MPLARASELDRLFACPGSAWLPRLDMRSDNARKAARWGDLAHKWAETGELPSDEKERKALQKRIADSGTDRLQWWPEGGHREATLAYNVVTGEALKYDEYLYALEATRSPEPYPTKDEWKANFDDQWITGSFDYAADVFGEPWVDDLKTGRFVTWTAYQAQQTFYCLAWSKVEYGEVLRTRSTVTHWPRYPTRLPPLRFGSVLEVDKLNAFAESLRILRDKILAGRAGESSEAVLSLGEHCGFCPSRSQCPKFGREQSPLSLEDI